MHIPTFVRDHARCCDWRQVSDAWLEKIRAIQTPSADSFCQMLIGVRGIRRALTHDANTDQNKLMVRPASRSQSSVRARRLVSAEREIRVVGPHLE
ncbi:MAG: hypothetical protein KatS3mg113_0140 [Planctomycetaceae bacterium]|nr:MAG: hypothetical protein KatS3mg113_0140 [Planctomycetaceae bacterium]